MGIKLKKIAPVQAGKVFAVFYGLFSLIGIPFMLLSAFFAPGGKMPGILFGLLLWVLYIVLGFFGGIISALFYNLAAKWVGGIDLIFED